MNKVLPFEYSIRKSKRAKRLLIHVEEDGSVEVVVPWRVAKVQAERFVREKQTWIERVRAKHLQEQAAIPRRQLVTGETLPYFGEKFDLVVELESGRRRAFVQEDVGQLIVRARDVDQVREKITAWYRTKTRDYFVGQAIVMAERLGKRVEAVKVLNTKSQWGSCNRQKAILTFHWRLALGPESVARYVVAHEVAHLVHANHSADFWAVVEELLPGYTRERKWLRKNGKQLVL